MRSLFMLRTLSMYRRTCIVYLALLSCGGECVLCVQTSDVGHAWAGSRNGEGWGVAMILLYVFVQMFVAAASR